MQLKLNKEKKYQFSQNFLPSESPLPPNEKQAESLCYKVYEK